jgi:hypothetical protein
VKVIRYAGTTATGSGGIPGGSGGYQTLPALGRGQNTILTFTDVSAPVGTVTYQVQYNATLEGDAHHANDRARATVTHQ